MASQTDLWTVVHQVWHIGVAGLALLLSIIASGHAVLYKRDSRAAIAWVGFVWLVPLVGAVLYLIFGINRLRRQALLLRSDLERYRAHSGEAECPPEELHRHLPPHSEHLEMLARVVGEVVAKPLLAGNRVEPLLNGDETYPAMLDAIRNAKQTVSFLTYIFDRDEIGLEFAKAFGEATRRGVEVRVLIDAAGTRYSMPTILRTLRREKVRYARFLPAFALWRMMSMNLRTHRKILVADGRLGFTGGLNIRVGHCLQKKPGKPVQDIHFDGSHAIEIALQHVDRNKVAADIDEQATPRERACLRPIWAYLARKLGDFTASRACPAPYLMRHRNIPAPTRNECHAPPCKQVCHPLLGTGCAPEPPEQ